MKRLDLTRLNYPKACCLKSESRLLNHARDYACAMAMVVLLSLVSGCNPTAEPGTNSGVAGAAPTAKRGQVVVTNLPLRYFAQSIVGDLVDVTLPVPAEEDPAFWQPSTEAISSMQAADVICLNGATYESWLATVTLPETRITDTSSGFKDKFIEMGEGLTHSHGPAGEHTHTGIVGTTWIDFDQARQQATAMLAALIKRWPDHQSKFEANFAELKSQLETLDRDMQQVAAKMQNVPVVVSHPIYDYWLRRYGLNGKAVHWEAGDVPTPENIEELKKLLGDHPAKYMIWEGDPAPEAIKILADMGLTSVVFTPAGNGSADEQWLSIMQENIDRLKAIFP